MTKTITETKNANGAAESSDAPVNRQSNSDRSMAAEASSAHSRINIPLNLENWKSLSPVITEELVWLHQWVLDNNIGWSEASEALGYERSVIFRVLKGTYTGNWDNIVKAIKKYRWKVRKAATQIEFVENRITRDIIGAFDYACANNCITIVEAESRMGKTMCGVYRLLKHNHGKTVLVTAPVIGGVSACVRRLASRCGINKNAEVNYIVDALYRAFNGSRHLIIDEAHRLMPNDYRVANPQKLEFIRDLHDETGCAVTLLVTARFRVHLKRGSYQYEQLVGRSKLVQVKPNITQRDIEPIVRQFVSRPSASLMETLVAMANKPGRLGVLTEVLRMARRGAEHDKEPTNSAHVLEAISERERNAGDFAR